MSEHAARATGTLLQGDGTPPEVLASIATPDTVETRIGALQFERGYPTEETKHKLFDEIDYQRAVQAYLWAYPAVSFESIRIGAKRDLGADLNDLVIADNYADPKGLWLTANDTTIWSCGRRLDGP